MQAIRSSRVTEPTDAGLCRAAVRAIAHAQQTGTAFLRVHLPLAPVDPFVFLEDEPTNRFAWQDGLTGNSFVGVGVAAEVRVEGEDRFVRAQTVCEAISRQMVSTSGDGRPIVDELPLLVGGFAFSPTAPSLSSPWARWPVGWLVLPRLLVHECAGQVRAVLCEPVSDDETPTDVLARLEHRRQALQPAKRSVPRLAPSQGTFDDAQTPADDAARSMWVSRAEQARAETLAGQMDKVVLARATKLTAAAFDQVGTLRRLRQRHGGGAGSSTLYFVQRQEAGAFVGATPETLVYLRGRTVSTAALAGTAPRYPDPGRDDAAANAMKQSIKELAEHRYVVEAIVKALRPHCGRLLVDEQPKVRRLRLIQHLETGITGLLRRPCHLLELVRSLHPTPAVGGWPTGTALRWLREGEGLERGWYAGPLGWLTARGEGHFIVALRCALLNEQHAWAYAGAGLTARSLPAAEWAETELKLATLAEALVCREGNASGGDEQRSAAGAAAIGDRLVSGRGGCE